MTSTHNHVTEPTTSHSPRPTRLPGETLPNALHWLADLQGPGLAGGFVPPVVQGLGRRRAPEQGPGEQGGRSAEHPSPWSLAGRGWCVMMGRGRDVLWTLGCGCALCGLHVPSAW